MKKYSNLFSPLKVGNLTFRNRIVMAPTSGANFFTLTPEGYLTRESIAYYELKAAGGAAAVTIAEGVVHSKTGQHHPVLPLDDPMILPSLAMAASAIKCHGAIPSIELQHAGKHGGLARV